MGAGAGRRTRRSSGATAFLHPTTLPIDTILCNTKALEHNSASSGLACGVYTTSLLRLMYAGARVFSVFSDPNRIPSFCNLLVQIYETKTERCAPLPRYSVRLLFSLTRRFVPYSVRAFRFSFSATAKFHPTPSGKIEWAFPVVQRQRGNASETSERQFPGAETLLLS
jgi:hypothetical protein